MQRAVAAFRAVFRPVWRDERGVTLAITAVTMTALLAITGLAVDAGWWYALHRQNQSAADAAAISAAYQVVNALNSPDLITAPTQSDLIPFATDAAQQNGYGGTTPDVAYPYNGGNAVEVRLHQPQSTWFAAFANIDSVTISNRAVATVNVLDSPCTYVLDPTADKALNISGSASLSTPSCAICVNSNADDAVFMNGATNAVLQADSLLIRGTIQSKGQPNLTLNNPAQFGYSGCTDPYAESLTHGALITGMPSSPTSPTCGVTASDSTLNTITYAANCTISGVNINTPKNSSGGKISMSGDTQITGDWEIKGETVNLAPGTYWITDGNLILDSGSSLTCTACTPGGAGVTIILTTANDGTGTGRVGNVIAGSNGQAGTVGSLNAPGSGNFANLLLIQDSNDLPSGTTPTTPCNGSPDYSCSTFQGGPSSNFTGLVYFPDSALDFQGNPKTGNYTCLLTVAKTMSLQGNPTGFATSGCPTTGLGGVKKIYTAALVE